MKKINDESFFYYRVYGLNIKSQLELEELVVVSEMEEQDVDININCEDMPINIKNEIEVDRNMFFSRNDVWFKINDIAIYRVTDGNKITFEPFENTDTTLLKIYLMCSCLGIIMIQREHVAIHGGTVVIDGKGVIFTGDRGAGKSTLTNAFREKGYKFISDDVAAIGLEKMIYIKHGFPYQKLCEDAVESMGYNNKDFKSFYADVKRKYLIPVEKGFIYNDVELDVICEISIGDVESVVIEEVLGNKKLSKLIKNIYKIEYLEHMGGMTPEYFKKCIAIAKKTKIYKIIRPRNGFTINEQIEVLENTLKA